MDRPASTVEREVVPTRPDHGVEPRGAACAVPSVAASERRAFWLGCLTAIAIGAVTFVALSPALENGFVEWDDPALITGNEAYRGLGWPQVSWMFSNVLMGHYVPLTWLTLGLDYTLWGLRPRGYHLTNLLLHAANAALFWLVALRILGTAMDLSRGALRLAATASALFFALHPLRAESVAWITERRDVLSGLFFFLTVLLHLESQPPRGTMTGQPTRRYWIFQALAWLTYLAAILSKSIVMALPALLIILDVYPLRRLGPDWRGWTRPPAWLVWREKIPYLALGLLAAMLGYYGQAANRYFTSLERVHWADRPALVVYSLWFYVWKTFMPTGLSPLYELPARIHPLAWGFLGPAVAVLASTAVVLALRRRWPAGLAVWLAYAMTVLPVSGAVHAGYQLAHDRYSYLSCLGWALLVGAGVGAFARLSSGGALSPAVARAGAAAIAAGFLGLAALGWHQAQAWRDTETLWRTAVDAQPDCAVCEDNLGVDLFKQRLFAAAGERYERALALRPDRVHVHYNLGVVFTQFNDVPRAAREFERVVSEHPADVDALMNLGVARMKQGRAAEGVMYLRRAMMLKPDDYLVLSNFGLALTETGNARDALRVLERAIAVKPGGVEAVRALMRAQLALENVEGARRAHDMIRNVDGNLATALAPLLVTEW